MQKDKGPRKLLAGKKLIILFIIFAFVSTLVISMPGFAKGRDGTRELNPNGSLPGEAKRINEIIYPTFGYPAIVTRGDEITLEFDVRKSIPGAPQPQLENWQVSISSTIARNKNSYHPDNWYNHNGGSYGNYQDPVHTVTTTYDLPVILVERGPSERWPLIFDQANFVVDKVTVKVPYRIPLDLYDLTISCEDAGGPGTWTDSQPHALKVIDEYKRDIEILQIADIHVFGREIASIGPEYMAFTMREPRPNCPLRWEVWPFTTFVPHDEDDD